MKGEIKMQSKPPSSYRSGSSLPVQNATGRRDINHQRKHQPSKRVPNSADESASVETRGAIELC